MPTETFTYPGPAGQDRTARLDLPDGPVLASAIFAHCFDCAPDTPATRRIPARLAAMGIAVLQLDITAGDDAHDIAAAAAALADRALPPTLLVGHSRGGTAMLAARHAVPGIRAVATIGAPGPADSPDLGHLHAALLVLHAPRDMVVGIDHATRIFTAARHPKSFVSLDDADHQLSDPADAEYAAGVIAAWAARYLRLPPPAPDPAVPEGTLRVSEADPAGFLQDIQSGPRHHLQADEPRDHGGTDRGLSPYGLVAAGLGACTSMTIRMYARRKGWPLAHVAVDVSHAKVHAQDAGTAGEARIDEFRRVIRLTGDLTPDQIARLRDIADKCPVHRTLHAGARITTDLAASDAP